MSSNSLTSSGRGNSKKRSRSSRQSLGKSTKSSKKSNSHSPSANANNSHCHKELDRRTRSVLSHPLGLALLLAFHDTAKVNEDLPLWLNSFQEKKATTTYNTVLEESVAAWRKNQPEMKETTLTDLIETTIKKKNWMIEATTTKKNDVLVEGQVRLLKDNSTDTSGIMDMVVGTKGDNTPSLVMEVGLNNGDWFKKLDQAIKYLKIMCLKANATNNCTFQKPLLLAIVIIGKERVSDNTVDFQIGVFLCSPKNIQSNTPKDDFRMSLLWQSSTKSLRHASKLFGRTLMIAQGFGMCRDNFNIGDTKYEYLSSNCCKIQWKVEGKLVTKILRIYDKRYHESSRSPTVYNSWPPLASCTVDILALERPEQVVSIEGFRDKPLDQILRIISTPYREGKHFAEKPTDFIPIIDQLKDLQDAGFVHGDIRAYNMIFGTRDSSNKPQGWLIDFDFGGEVGVATYPPGYKGTLADGIRFGEQGQHIEKWHDWFALGSIIFHLHGLKSPPTSTSPLGPEKDAKRVKCFISFNELYNKWNALETAEHINEEDIEELKAFL